MHPLLSGTTDLGSLPQSERFPTMGTLLQHLLFGWAIILAPGQQPLGVALEGLQQRSVDEPTTEREVIGPKEALVENLETNIGLLRNRLRDLRLRVSVHTVGRRSQTRVALVYIDGVASQELVDRTSSALSDVDIDFVRTATDISEIIFGRSLTPFPLVEQTERPDRVADALALGRIGLIRQGRKTSSFRARI